MKKHIQTIIFVLFAVILFSACQPTPEKQIVIDKKDLQQEIEDKTVQTSQKIIANTDQVANTEHTDTWQDQYKDKKGIFNVKIDAQVILPDVTSFPVEKMTLSQISDSQLIKIASALFGDKTIYDGNIPRTKDEIAKDIVELKEKIQNEGLKTDEDYLKELDNEYNKAPEEAKLEQVQPSWKETSKGFKTVDLMAQDSNGKRAFLNAVTSEKEKCFFEYKIRDEEYFITETENDKPNGVSMSEEDAEKLALKTAEDMGLENVKIVSKNIGGLIKTGPWNLSKEKQCYIFFLSRTVDGIPFAYVSKAGGDFMTDEKPYAPPVNQETIEIHISDSGVVYLDWESPYEVSKNISGNVKLLDFEDIKNKFIDQMKKEGEGRDQWYGMNGIIDDCINVNRVELGMMITIDKDNPHEFLSIPVWDFFVTTKQTYADKKARNSEEDESNYSILTINAINGGIVNRNLGY